MTNPHDGVGARSTFVSLYSGCGGLDLGFARAGFQPVWANDFDQYAVDTYNRIPKVTSKDWEAATNAFVGHQAICGDIRETATELGPGAADLVIGGPPCQGFSVAGRMNPSDPRSKHVFEFLKVVRRVRPRAFVMENVAALARNRRWTDIIEQMRQLAGKNYKTELVVLNASHWEVPQARERMFLIGLPPDAADINLQNGTSRLDPPSAGQALKQLPTAGSPGNESVCSAKITLARAPVKRRSPFAGMLFNGQGRLIDLNRPAPTLPASMGGNRTPIIDLDQLETGASPWIVEYHRRVALQGLPPLPEIPLEARMRRITVEEAAALQTFPADLDWQGPQSARYRQIGNAVPPNLAFAVASAVREAIR